MSQEPQTPVDPGPKGPQLDDMLDSLMGWNWKFLRTVKDGLLQPEKVAGAVLTQDHDTYASPLRLLVFLFSLYTGLMLLLMGSQLQSIEMFTPASRETLQAWLVEQGQDLDTVNDVWAFWLTLLNWPVMVFSALPYALLFKAYAPTRTLYGAVLVYLTTINAMTFVQIVLMVGLALILGGENAVALSLLLVLFYYFYVTARVLSAHYATTLAGTILKVFSFMLLTPVTLVITVALQFLAFDQVMEHRFDLNVRDMIELRGDTAP